MMIMGFDVCHDSQNKSVSYGALVSSLNDTHTNYFSCVQPHRSGEELSTHFSISIASKYIHWIQKFVFTIILAQAIIFILIYL